MIQNFVSKLSEKEKKIFYVAIIFVLVALLDRLFIGPAMDKLKSLEGEIESQESLIKRDLRFLSYKNRILRENQGFKKYYAQRPLSEEEIIASFLKKIEILASESKVNLIRVSPSESKQRKGFVEYFATLECDGPLENVAKFCYTIDISEDLLRIVKFSMAPKRAGSQEVAATMSVSKVIIDSSALKDAELLSSDLADSNKETSAMIPSEQRESKMPSQNAETVGELQIAPRDVSNEAVEQDSTVDDVNIR